MAATKSSLDSLPPEVKLELMKIIPLSSLSNLVHASPDYHALYANNRELLLTTATLDVLDSLFIDILTPSAFVEIGIKHAELTPVVKCAVIKAREDHDKGSMIKLEVRECIALLAMSDWTAINKTEDGYCGCSSSDNSNKLRKGHVSCTIGFEISDAEAAHLAHKVLFVRRPKRSRWDTRH